jgi:sporulation protein YlmC with PRC-barrel domain
MLTNISFLTGLSVQAVDGKIGRVEQFYFDDETCRIRYLIVNTGNWLSNRLVLISPASVIRMDWGAKQFDLSLTKKQIEDSPDIDTHKPISRQHEATYLGYYGIPYYWGGPPLYGSAGAFEVAGYAISGVPDVTRELPITEPVETHLRSTDAVNGYDVQATDGEIGHVDGFVIDDELWSIRYLEVATRNWLPGKKVLISPEWVERWNWKDSKVFVALTVEAIKAAPEYLLSEPLTREYEKQLHIHYGRPPYWMKEHNSELSFAGA